MEKVDSQRISKIAIRWPFVSSLETFEMLLFFKMESDGSRKILEEFNHLIPLLSTGVSALNKFSRANSVRRILKKESKHTKCIVRNIYNIISHAAIILVIPSSDSKFNSDKAKLATKLDNDSVKTALSYIGIQEKQFLENIKNKRNEIIFDKEDMYSVRIDALSEWEKIMSGLNYAAVLFCNGASDMEIKRFLKYRQWQLMHEYFNIETLLKAGLIHIASGTPLETFVYMMSSFVSGEQRATLADLLIKLKLDPLQIIEKEIPPEISTAMEDLFSF